MGVKPSEVATDQGPLSSAQVNVYSCTSTRHVVFATLRYQVQSKLCDWGFFEGNVLKLSCNFVYLLTNQLLASSIDRP
jgi:hypothetical protein